MVALLTRPDAPALPQEPATDPFEAALVWARILRYRPADVARIEPWYGPETCAMFVRELWAIPWGEGWRPLTPDNVIAAPPAVLRRDWRDAVAMRQAKRVGTKYLDWVYGNACACERGASHYRKEHEA
jgi:hypothetical protein